LALYSSSLKALFILAGKKRTFYLIGDYAFEGISTLVTVTIPTTSTLKTIGDYAFPHSSL
jgi:hypothetical protein